MILWIFIGLLLLAILLLVAGRLVAARRGDAAADHDHDLRVYRDQLKELERDVERGLLDEEAADAARVEIQRRLLNAGDKADMATGNTRPRPLLAGVVAMLVGGGSVALYLALGSPEIPDMPFALREMLKKEIMAEGPGEQPAGMPDLEQALAGLSAKLKENPQNVEGWLLLGRTQLRLQKYAEAVEAFANAEAQGANDPVFHAEYGVAMVFAEKGNVSDKAADLFQRALKARPKMIVPRHHLALKLAREQKFEEAIREWKNMLSMAKAGDEWITVVERNIVEAAKAGNLDPDSVAPSPAFRAAYENRRDLAPPLSQETIKDVGQMNAEDQSRMIQSMVERLATRLENNPDDLNGWLRLGNAYRVLNRPDDSARAYANAARLDDGNGQTAELYERALVEAAQSARQAGDTGAAREFLETLLARLHQDSPEYDLIKQQIDELR